MPDMAKVIMDAAERRIRIAGYNALSFRDLADDAKIKSSSVHYYFRRKEDLGVALVKRYHERFFNAVSNASRDTQSASGKLKAFCQVYREALRAESSICLCGMLGAESQGLPSVVRNEVESFFSGNIEWLAEAMPRTVTKKNRYKNAMQIVASLQGAMILAVSLNNNTVFDDTARRVLQDGRVQA